MSNHYGHQSIPGSADQPPSGGQPGAPQPGYQHQPPPYQQPHQPPSQHPPAQGPQADHQPPAAGYQSQPPTWSQGYEQPPHDNFFKSLFDLEFKSFITLTFAKIIFVVSLGLIGLTYLFVVIGAFGAARFGGGGLAVFMAIVGGGVGAAIAVVYVRVLLEFLIAQIRTAENTSVLAQRR